jgi:hypothetical protein
MSSWPIADRPTPRPRTGAVRMRRVLVLAGCGMLGVGLSACESTEQESAKIGRENAAAARAAAKPAASTHGGARSHARGRGSTHGASHKGSASP